MTPIHLFPTVEVRSGTGSGPCIINELFRSLSLYLSPSLPVRRRPERDDSDGRRPDRQAAPTDSVGLETQSFSDVHTHPDAHRPPPDSVRVRFVRDETGAAGVSRVTAKTFTVEE